MSEITSFPLTWPSGYPRIARPAGNFRFYPQSVYAEIAGVKDELGRMDARNIIISTNIPLKNDGNPYSTYQRPADAGVAIYFQVDGKAMALCCDKWNSVEANLKALKMSIDALRGLDRWGVSDILDRAFMGFKALPEKAASFPWWEVLGLERNCTKKEVEAAYKKQAKKAHPDNGGDPHKWAQLQEAFSQGLKQTA